MKFQISKQDFLEGLSQVQNVVSTRTTLPILGNVLIEAGKDSIRFTTTDLDVGVSASVPAQVSKEGTTTLPTRRLAGIIGSLPSDTIDVSVTSDVATIQSGASNFKILGLPAEEFPQLTSLEESMEFTIAQASLKESLKKTGYAICTDETRYVLTGIYFVFEKNSMTLVATDGRRLALVENELEFPESQEVSIIVPNKAVTELTRLLGNEGELTLRVGESHVAFELGTAELICKLIEGNYPNYRQVIPSETKHRVTVEREIFLDVINRIALLTNDKSSSIKLNFTKDNIEVVANTPEIGEAQENLPVKYKGDDMSIAFNPDYMTEPLKNLSSDEVYLELIDEVSPGLLKNESSFLYVLMPMRVNS